MSYSELSVLVVDDDHQIRDAFSAVLGSVGYRVRTAQNGIEALRRIREEVPALILSDLDMPEMSGFEFLSVVHRRFASIKIVAMSGAFQENTIPTGLHADAFYPKGAGSPAVLLTALEYVLTEHPTGPNSAPNCASALPLWIAEILYPTRTGSSILLTCTECLRAFPHNFTEAPSMTVRQADCIFCETPITFSVVTTTLTSKPQQSLTVLNVLN